MTAAARREQLLDICARIVDVAGFHAATIERVSSEAGVTRTVVYQQFGGLDGMLDAVVERAAARAAATLRDAGVGSSAAPADVVGAVLVAADRDPATWRLFLVVPPAGPAALVDALDAGRAALRRHLARALADAGTTADPELAARLVQAAADEVVRLRLADPSQYDHERLLRQFAAVVDALVAPSPVRHGARSSARSRPIEPRNPDPDQGTDHP